MSQRELFPVAERNITVYVDGACSGNPGDAGCGAYFVIREESAAEKEQFFSAYIGKATNNIAEYTALYLALEALRAIPNATIEVFTDSELMAKQLAGEYKVKNERIIPIFRKIKALLGKLNVDKIEHIPRENNRIADRLARRAIELGRLVGQSGRA